MCAASVAPLPCSSPPCLRPHPLLPRAGNAQLFDRQRAADTVWCAHPAPRHALQARHPHIAAAHHQAAHLGAGHTHHLHHGA
eukprot:358397-Chlamydomonas_euryale.AAC.2